MLLPIRSKNPPESTPFVTITLMLVNVVVFAFTTHNLEVTPEMLAKLGQTYHHATLLNSLTSMFLHANFMHLAGNMWFLYILGFAVEGRLRWWKFLVVYLGSGLIGDVVFQCLVGRLHPDLPSLGASGAITGVMGAALFMFPFAQVDFFYCFGLGFLYDFFCGVKSFAMWVVCLMYPGVDLLISMFLGDLGDGTAHLAHVGGLIGGLMLCALFRPRRDSRVASDAKACFSDTKDLGLSSRYELEEISRGCPDDTLIALHWLNRSIRDNRVEAPCREHFMKMLKRVVAEQPIGSVGSCLLALNAQPGAVDARSLITAARKAEEAYEPVLALRLYQSARENPNLHSEELETILYRQGMIFESSLNDRKSAGLCYESVVSSFPMSPLADQAKARLRVLHSPAQGLTAQV